MRKGNAMKKYLCAGAALLLTLALAACGGSGKGQSTAASNGTGSSSTYPELRWGMSNLNGSIDWIKTISPAMLSIEQLAVQNLMAFEPDGKVVPGLASSVERPTPTTYVYHLKSVKFSTGKPLTSADVVFSLKRNLSDEAWTKAYWEDVASVSARGASTVVIKLKRPSAFWQQILAFTGQITEKAQIERIGTKALGTPGNLPIGTGPWKLDSYQPEASIQLSRNPYWTGPQPPAAKINVSIFKDEASLALALRSHAVDGTFNYFTPKTFENIPGMRTLKAPGILVVFVGVNTTRAPFTDVHVRRAIAYASDAAGMIRAGSPGAATEDASIVPTSTFSSLGSTSQVNAMLEALPKYHFDLVAAKQELAKSAYPHGFTTEIQVPESSGSGEQQDAEILAADLAKIGITAKIFEEKPDEEAKFNAEASKLVTMKVELDYSPYADPEGVLGLIFPPSQIGPPGSGLNFASYRNSELDKLQLEEAETLSPTRRLQSIGDLLGIAAREAPYWPLYTLDALATLSEKYVYPTFSGWTSIYGQWAMDVKLAS